MQQPLPAALSPSRLADFQTCPRRFQYAAVERIPQVPTYAMVKGTFVHFVFESLFRAPSPERSREFALASIPAAVDKVLGGSSAEAAGLTATDRERMINETKAIVDTYFDMERPDQINVEGVELKVSGEMLGVPMLGILDRLDRSPDGDLTIVDYKTGSVPRRDFDTHTFANAELYGALCEDVLGERPRSIKLLYVTHGETLERTITEPVLKARRASARSAWDRIQRFHEDGRFPATPSKSACRFCTFKDVCRSSGVAVAG